VNKNEGYRKKRGSNTRVSIHNIEQNAKGHVCMEGEIEYMSSSRNKKKPHNKNNRHVLEPLSENCDSDLESMDSHERTLVSAKPNSSVQQGNARKVDVTYFAADQAVNYHLNNGVAANQASHLVAQGPLHGTGCYGTGIPVDNAHKRKSSTPITPQFDEESVVSINSKYVKIASQSMFAAQALDKKTQYREQANKTFVRSSSSGSSRRKREPKWKKLLSKFASKYTSKQMLYIAILSVLAMTCVFSSIGDIDDTNVVDMRSPTGGIMDDARQIENGRLILAEETPPKVDEEQFHTVEDIERERRGGKGTENLDDAPPHLRGFYAKRLGINDPQQIVETANPGLGGPATMQDMSEPKPIEVVNTQDIMSQLEYHQQSPSMPASTQPPPPVDNEPPPQQKKTLQDRIQDGQDMLAAISQQVEEGQRDGRFGQKPLPPYFAKHVEAPGVDQQQAEVHNEQGQPPPVEQQQMQEQQQQQIMDGQAFEAQLQSQAFNGADQPVMNPEILLPAGVVVNVDQQQQQQQQLQEQQLQQQQLQQQQLQQQQLQQQQQYPTPEEVDQSQQQTIDASIEAIEANLAEFSPAPIVEGQAGEGSDVSQDPARQQDEALSPREEYLANAQDIAQQLMIAQTEHEQIMQQTETEGQVAPAPQVEEQTHDEDTPEEPGDDSMTDEVRAQRKRDREERRKQERLANLQANDNIDIGVPIVDAKTFESQLEEQEKNEGAISGTRAGLMEKEDFGPNDK